MAIRLCRLGRFFPLGRPSLLWCSQQRRWRRSKANPRPPSLGSCLHHLVRPPGRPRVTRLLIAGPEMKQVSTRADSFDGHFGQQYSGRRYGCGKATAVEIYASFQGANCSRDLVRFRALQAQCAAFTHSDLVSGSRT